MLDTDIREHAVELTCVVGDSSGAVRGLRCCRCTTMLSYGVTTDRVRRSAASRVDGLIESSLPDW